ncbi:CPBP family intramembrane glutamic endopeptidase [Paenibacillus silviterrae]|uniref:CPBP family intramembrane glutamic endopeptidase n=1 Tax=Paenibacillus silviterrae TaxID=3242194 RepID=UPI002542BBEE|nr:type II CAAX endopeptidase family protein [Paenibacillus chinjuensis]
MNKNYILILVIFFLFTGPGPSLFFLNKYTVSFLPLISIIAVIYLLKDEIKFFDFQQLISKEIMLKAWLGIQVGVYAHAACALMFPAEINLTEQLLSNYAVMAVNIVLIGPIIEEIVYRKIIFGFLHQKFGFFSGAVLSSLLFSLAHFSMQRALAYFAVGMILCYISYKQSSNLPNIYAHIILNYAAILAQTIKIT